MTDALNLTQSECAQRASVVHAPVYAISIDLTHAADPTATTFTSHTTLIFDATGESTWLDLVADSIESATLNGQPIDTSGYDGARLPLEPLLPHNTVDITARCAFRNTGDGLHRFTDPQDNNTYLYTHFEPTDARRMFACFEQPDLKAQFEVSVTAPSDWQVRSNQPAVASPAQGDVTVTRFGRTPLMSTYLVALAAGPYATTSDLHVIERADGSRQEIALGLLCRQTMREYLDEQDIFTVTKQGLDFFDEHFGFPYPWGKYDQVFVPEYNIGAMENPGLVSWNENFLYRGGATKAQRGQRAEVILHEMSHMWFGDLATMQWWDGLWLKESFADLMGYQVAQAATDYPDGWVQLALGRKQWAYTEDQMPTTHPIVATIPDLEAARQNFDGISYAKGAATLKQLSTYVGTDQFFAGARAYFAEHAYGSTTLDDLLTAMEGASGEDLRDWARAWWQTSGPSHLTPVVTRDGDGAITALRIEQHGVDHVTGQGILRPHRFTVSLFALSDGSLQLLTDLPVTLTERSVALPEAVGLCADLIVLNAADETYAVTALDERSLATAGVALAQVTPDLTRAVAWSTLWGMVRDGGLSAATFADVFATQTISEPNPSILTVLAFLGAEAVGTYTPQADRPGQAARLLQVCLDQAARTAPGSDEHLIWVRGVAGLAALTDACSDEVAALATLEDLPTDLRWRLTNSLAATGSWSVADLDAQLAGDDTMTGRTAYAQAIASRPGRAVKEQVWKALTDGSPMSNDHRRALLAGYRQPFSAADTRADLPAYLDGLEKWWKTLGQTDAERMIAGLFPLVDVADGDLATHPVLTAVRAWLLEHQDAPSALYRTVQKALATAERSINAQSAY
ncbi:aminopeptidase N [Branchiibius hedensis]|uniref:aminopeptidase N n=1 Tax=Branchiibius hedensis TaxID=672460 RepID=UPI0014746C6A|nr:aminopeptidase N [Branchiibius hedensis]